MKSKYKNSNERNSDFNKENNHKDTSKFFYELNPNRKNVKMSQEDPKEKVFL